MQDASLAVGRIEENRSIGLRRVEIGTYINGITLGDGHLHDIHAALERAGLMLMIHWLRPLGVDRMGGLREPAAVAAFPLRRPSRVVDDGAGAVCEAADAA